VDERTGQASQHVTEHIALGPNCRNSQAVVLNEVPLATYFRMPMGGASGEDSRLLTINAFSVTQYPMVRFNDDGDDQPDPAKTEWYVATAYDYNTWLSRGWDVDFVASYNDYGDPNVTPDYHPGDDWNLNTGGNSDLGEPVSAVANGIVLFAGCAYGNTVIIAHRLTTGEIVTSFYGHLNKPSPYRQGQVLDGGATIGVIGHTSRIQSKCVDDASMGSHLHFEIRRGHVCTSSGCADVGARSMLTIKYGTRGFDPATATISLKYLATMWPATEVAALSKKGSITDDGKAFIELHYYDTHQFMVSRAP
jgi:hypothetical protein